MRKRILYLKLWCSALTNIGDAFIDLGVIYSIQQTESVQKGKALLIPVSIYSYVKPSQRTTSILTRFPRPLVSLSKIMLGRYFEKTKETILQSYTRKANKNIKSSLLVHAIKPDYVVISGGLIFTKFQLDMFKPLLDNLKRQGAKIIFYGCSGETYSDLEVECVKRRLEEIEPYAIITRDQVAFRHYKDIGEYAFNGIDCGFFVNKLPIKEIEIDFPPYVVLTFDSYNNIDTERKLEVELSKKYTIVKTSHQPISEISVFRTPKRDAFVSDSPYDYLILYAHTEETHADRVHACVATLSFGNPCRLYLKTARAELFRRIGIEPGSITKKLVTPDLKRIEELQKAQIDFLSSVLI